MRFLFILLFTAAIAQQLTPKCRSHPAFQPNWKPPLLRAWKRFRRPALFEKTLYAPRHPSRYHPAGNPKSDKYNQLDLLYIGGSNAKGTLARLYFNRPVKIYLFIGVRREGRSARLRGWKSEGYAKLSNPRATDIRYGVFQRGTILLPQAAYVFSKQVKEVADIPTEERIWNQINLRHNIRTHIRLAESNGKRSPSTGTFKGRKIRPNTKCPEALHRTWVAKHSDTRDSALKGRVFGSWHPVWDPCFWCTYGHDHGSNPKALMGYEPTFEYTALKNGNENESHQGFKGFVFNAGNYKVYFNVHAQTSKLRRISEQYHTAVIVVVDAKGKIRAELNQKADFGFLAARGGIGVGFVPLRPQDRKLMLKQNLNLGKKRVRSVNVIDKNNLDKRFRYQLRRANLLRGVYEGWITGVMCGLPKRGGEMTVDFKNAITGVKSAKQLGTLIKLGQETQNVGLFRSIQMDITMGIQHCKFKNGRTKGGVFYTDPRGERLVKGPGPKALRQYIDPKLKFRMHGHFEVKELGLGLFVDKATGFWADHGFGIDVSKN